LDRLAQAYASNAATFGIIPMGKRERREIKPTCRNISILIWKPPLKRR
jgi:hypothetical protein